MAIKIQVTLTFDTLKQLLEYIDTQPDHVREQFVKHLKEVADRELKRRKTAHIK